MIRSQAGAWERDAGKKHSEKGVRKIQKSLDSRDCY